MRDDFSKDVVERLAKRAGFLCSAPDCGVPCVGPSDESSSAYSNIGRAAHITAASPGGPRFDPALTPEQRRAIENAIWLCASDAALIDTDTKRYTVELLQSWKQGHDERVRAAAHRIPGLMEAREAAYLDWVNRVRAWLTSHKIRISTTEPGKHIPVGRLLAPSERTWAARAVAEGHVGWMTAAEGVVLPGDSFSFQPSHPHEAIQCIVLNPGSFGDEPDLKEFLIHLRRDFLGVSGQAALEFGPPRGRSFFFRLGWPKDGPQPVAVGVGPAGGSGPLGFMHDKVEEDVKLGDRWYRYFGASNPLTATASAYLVFATADVPSTLVAGVAPAPIGPPARWSRIDLRLT